MTLHALVVSARERLIRAGLSHEAAAIDAEVLARETLGWDRARYLAERAGPAPERFARRYSSAIERRAGFEPVAYIVGHREFWGLDFEVTPAVLIPRPESELIVEEAISRLQACGAPAIADIGTGSGCLAVSLAHEMSDARVVGTDVAAGALAVAARNAMRHGVRDRVRFVRASLLDGLTGPFDAIVANPPYVRAVDRPRLARDIVDHEPSLAIFGRGDDGMDELRAIVRQAPSRLRAGGWLLMEFGERQAAPLREMAAAERELEVVEILRDLQGHERTIVARTVL
jgi:release factor glutamine methyltransferase